MQSVGHDAALIVPSARAFAALFLERAPYVLLSPVEATADADISVDLLFFRQRDAKRHLVWLQPKAACLSGCPSCCHEGRI